MDTNQQSGYPSSGISSPVPTPAPASNFLGDIHTGLVPIHTRLREFSDRLKNAGFYSPPQATAADPTASEQPETIRQNISYRLVEINQLMTVIEYQLTQLA